MPGLGVCKVPVKKIYLANVKFSERLEDLNN